MASNRTEMHCLLQVGAGQVFPRTQEGVPRWAGTCWEEQGWEGSGGKPLRLQPLELQAMERRPEGSRGASWGLRSTGIGQLQDSPAELRLRAVGR